MHDGFKGIAFKRGAVPPYASERSRAINAASGEVEETFDHLKLHAHGAIACLKLPNYVVRGERGEEGEGGGKGAARDAEKGTAERRKATKSKAELEAEAKTANAKAESDAEAKKTNRGWGRK